MTLLQYRKNLRLLQARHLLFMHEVSVAEAADRVAYENASQFSRDYSRMFRISPGRDTSYFYSVILDDQISFAK